MPSNREGRCQRTRYGTLRSLLTFSEFETRHACEPVLRQGQLMAASTTRRDEASAGSSTERHVRKRRRVLLRILLLILLPLIAYTAFDMLAPRSSRMRS